LEHKFFPFLFLSLRRGSGEADRLGGGRATIRVLVALETVWLSWSDASMAMVAAGRKTEVTAGALRSRRSSTAAVSPIEL
jgi:hypothetical protein